MRGIKTLLLFLCFSLPAFALTPLQQNTNVAASVKGNNNIRLSDYQMGAMKLKTGTAGTNHASNITLTNYALAGTGPVTFPHWQYDGGSFVTHITNINGMWKMYSFAGGPAVSLYTNDTLLGQYKVADGMAPAPIVSIYEEAQSSVNFFGSSNSVFRATNTIDYIRTTPGSSNLPAITSTNDGTSGIYFPATGQVGVSIGGINAINVDAAGVNVRGNLDVTGDATFGSINGPLENLTSFRRNGTNFVRFFPEDCWILSGTLPSLPSPSTIPAFNTGNNSASTRFSPTTSWVGSYLYFQKTNNRVAYFSMRDSSKTNYRIITHWLSTNTETFNIAYALTALQTNSANQLVSFVSGGAPFAYTSTTTNIVQHAQVLTLSAPPTGPVSFYAGVQSPPASNTNNPMWLMWVDVESW